MRWRSLILPFVAVLIAVAMVFAMAINAELDAPATAYAADVLDVDVELAPARGGVAELERFAELRIEMSSVNTNDSNYSMSSLAANLPCSGRCNCPQHTARAAVDNMICDYDFTAGTDKARIGGEGAGVHAVPVSKGTGAGNNSRTTFYARASATAV